MRRWLIYSLWLGIVAFSASAPAFARTSDEAPAPRRMPREPVAAHVIAGTRTAVPPSRTVEGTATILDTERFRVGDIEVRLFGVVPPQLSASYGPQARAVLDGLNMAGPVTCTIRDRDRDGRFLATCLNAKQQDFSLELLKRGLAATARGSLRPTDLASPYIAAEQAAQAQKLGLWTVKVPSAVTDANIHDAAKAAQAAAASAKEEKDAQAAKEGAAKEAAEKDAAAKPEPQAEAPAVSGTTTLKADTNAAGKAPVPAQKPDMLPQPVGPTPDEIQAALSVTKDDAMTDASVAEPDFIERYQILISGLLMLLTVFGVGLTLFLQRILEQREERRSIAAALRGELMAARAVCLGRLQTMTGGQEDRAAAWPKIRVLVFQAYVGRIGKLGAERARQIASIYGLASDYAVYYTTLSPADAKIESVSKRQALQTLMKHIDEVLPSLALIEKGHSFFGGRKHSFSWMRGRDAALKASAAPSSGGLRQNVQDFFKERAAAVKAPIPAAPQIPQRQVQPPSRAQAPHQSQTHQPLQRKEPLAPPQNVVPQNVVPQTVVPQNVVIEKPAPVPSRPKQPVAPQEEEAQKREPEGSVEATVATARPQQPLLKDRPVTLPKEEEPVRQVETIALTEAEEKVHLTFPEEEPLAAEEAQSSVVEEQTASSTQQVAPGTLWGMLRKLASEHKDRAQPGVGDDYAPDYSNMTEAEMEALAYGLEPLEEIVQTPVPATRGGGRGGRRR